MSEAQLAWLARYARDAYAAHRRLDSLGIGRADPGSGAPYTLVERIELLMAAPPSLTSLVQVDPEDAPTGSDDA